MKIAVSTIAKNEVHNVADFVAGAKEADLVAVLDTGSTDGTVKALKKHKALIGETVIEPFRFDVARNEALDALPDDIDIVVSIDMDERLQPGWRAALERAWQSDFDSLSYWYIAEWADEAKTVPAVPSWRTKIFKRHGMKWFRPVHEVPLKADGSYPKGGFCKEVVVHHLQEGERNYEPLLSRLIEEQPEDEDAYLQRAPEWLKMGEYKKSIEDNQTYLRLTTGNQFADDQQTLRSQLIAGRRAYSYISIAQAKHRLGYAPGVIVHEFLRAAAECPQLREAWAYLADGYFSIGNYPAAYAAAMNALAITDNGLHSMDMRCWGDFPKQIADTAFAKMVAGQVQSDVLNAQTPTNPPQAPGTPTPPPTQPRQ